MLKQALNALTALHSRPVTLKRLGATVDMYSPARITPSNFFRFLRGPEYTSIPGQEFVIPIDSMTGEFCQLLTFSTIPDEGQFKLTFGASSTGFMAFNVSAASMQTELRLITALANVVVTGSFLVGFTIKFAGFSTAPALGSVTSSTLEAANVAVTATWVNTSAAWADKVKKGDRILDGTSLWTVDEIMPMYDLGATTMAYRCRVD